MKKADRGGVKHDNGKAPLHLLPTEALLTIAQVMGYGAQKYNAYNWLQGFAASRLYSATMRHLLSYWQGSDQDDETGLHPLDHALAELLMLRSLMLRNAVEDDRPPCP